MGVPKFYRWLSERYPLINQRIDDSTLLPGFDNLYLDMNGIIHNATHGNEGVSKSKTDKEVMLEMFAYIDHMVKIVKPQQLLYMAIDGVAPRAKMNQQRSRRFRAAHDSVLARAAAEEAGEKFEDKELFDSNSISPGTPFMERIHRYLQYFVRRKMRTDPMWRRLRVIYSGHNVPGEGEHKIVGYIRAMKSRPGYNPNTRHCMAGLDADLIMLGLATHEPHFALLRELIDFNAFRRSKHGTKTKLRTTRKVNWQLLHLGVLREYLEMEMRPVGVLEMPFDFDGERAIDDFVLMTVLCGNDFVPHLPSLDIGEGAMDALMHAYRGMLGDLGGYLVEDGGKINLARLEQLIRAVSGNELEVMRNRAAKNARIRQSRRREARRDARLRGDPDPFEGEEEEEEDQEDGDDFFGQEGDGVRVDDLLAQGVEPLDAEEVVRMAQAPEAAEERLNEAIRRALEETGGAVEGAGSPAAEAAAAAAEEAAMAVNPAQLGMKQAYYVKKMGITTRSDVADHVQLHLRARQAFIEALCWVMGYYYQGVPSWGWFYPFHYAPMMSDLVDLASYDIQFELGRPFRPYEQLMAILPAHSSKLLPAPLARLMTEEQSAIADFYPPVRDLRIDMNGKQNPWEGVVLVNFVHEQRLLQAVEAEYPKLSADERARNAVTEPLLIQYDAAVTDALASPDATVFPNLGRALTKAEPFVEPPLPEGGFQPIPPPGCVVPAPGYPTLHSLPLSFSRQKAQVNIHGRDSRNVSVLICVGPGGLIEGVDSRGRGALDLSETEFAAEAARLANEVVHAADGQEQLEPYRPLFSATYARGTAPGDLAAAGAAAAGTPPAASSDPEATLLPLGEGKATAAQVAAAALGKVVYCEWPHLREGLVVRVSDINGEVAWDPETCQIRRSEHRGTERASWAELASNIRGRLLRGSSHRLGRCGIVAGDVDVVLHVRKLMGMRRDPVDGSLSHVFAPEGTIGDVTVAAQLCLLRSPAPDARFQEQPARSLETQFPTGEPVVITEGPLRGEVGVVTGHDADKGKVALRVRPTPAEPPAFGNIIAERSRDRYTPFGKAAKKSGLGFGALGKIAASVKVKPGFIDIGLNLHVYKRLYLPDYCRSEAREAQEPAWSSTARSLEVAARERDQGVGNWTYSAKAMRLFQEYQHRFPDIVGAIRANPQMREYHVNDLGGLGRVEEVIAWLKSLEIAHRPLVPVTTQVVSERGALMLQEAARRVCQQQAQQLRDKPAAPIQVTSTPHRLFRPETEGYAVGDVGGGDDIGSLGIDGPDSRPNLGDRVVNLAFTQAQLGARATVVAVHNATGYVEIVFDRELVGGGSTLNGLCKQGHGALVPWSAVLPLRPPGAASKTRAKQSAVGAGGQATGGGRAGVAGAKQSATVRSGPSPSPVRAPKSEAKKATAGKPKQQQKQQQQQQQKQQQQQQQKQQQPKPKPKPMQSKPVKSSAAAATATAAAAAASAAAGPVVQLTGSDGQRVDMPESELQALGRAAHQLLAAAGAGKARELAASFRRQAKSTGGWLRYGSLASAPPLRGRSRGDWRIMAACLALYAGPGKLPVVAHPADETLFQVPAFAVETPTAPGAAASKPAAAPAAAAAAPAAPNGAKPVAHGLKPSPILGGRAVPAPAPAAAGARPGFAAVMRTLRTSASGASAGGMRGGSGVVLPPSAPPAVGMGMGMMGAPPASQQAATGAYLAAMQQQQVHQQRQQAMLAWQRQQAAAMAHQQARQGQQQKPPAKQDGPK